MKPGDRVVLLLGWTMEDGGGRAAGFTGVVVEQTWNYGTAVQLDRSDYPPVTVRFDDGDQMPVKLSTEFVAPLPEAP